MGAIGQCCSLLLFCLLASLSAIAPVRCFWLCCSRSFCCFLPVLLPALLRACVPCYSPAAGFLALLPASLSACFLTCSFLPVVQVRCVRLNFKNDLLCGRIRQVSAVPHGVLLLFRTFFVPCFSCYV